MVKRCVVQGCGNSSATGHSVHFFPKEKNMRSKWERFVKTTRAAWAHATATTVICGAHFVAPDDFEGYNKWKLGYATKLYLKKSAIPSKLRPKTPEKSEDSLGFSHTVQPGPSLPGQLASGAAQCTLDQSSDLVRWCCRLLSHKFASRWNRLSLGCFRESADFPPLTPNYPISR